MRVNAPYLLAGALSLSGAVSATLVSYEKRTPSVNNGQCGNISQDLVVDGTDFGPMAGCLCTGDNSIANFVSTNPACQSAVNAGWSTDIVALLVGAAVNDASPQLDTCAVPQFIPAPAGLPSGRKRSPAEIARAEHRCDFGLTKCGIYSAFGHGNANGDIKYGESTPAPYECVDVQTSLESCGGCVVPYSITGSTSPFDSLEDYDYETGVDCTALPGVSDVDCWRGQCLVRKCSKGYELVRSLDKDSNGSVLECVPIRGGSGDVHNQVGGTLEWKRHEM